MGQRIANGCVKIKTKIHCSGLYSQQYITEDAIVWAEGEAEWLPLKACTDLYSRVVFQGVH
jgi:hypothetical protein